MGCGGSSQSGGKGDASGKPEDKSDRKAAQAENKDYQAKMDFISTVPLMKRLPRDLLPLVAGVCTDGEFKAGDNVIEQGATGDTFYFIRSGEAGVHVKGDNGESKQVASLKSGDYFGENALLRDETRSATVVANSPLVVFMITRASFQELGLNDKLQFANRRAVAAGGESDTRSKPPTDKTPQQRALIAEALRKNEHLATITVLDDNRINAFIDAMWDETVPSGQELIQEGDLNAHYFYVVQSGEFVINQTQNQDGGVDNFEAKGKSKVVKTISPGGSFGELALLYLMPRNATVTAKVESKVWVVDRTNFKNILMKVSNAKVAEYKKYLDCVRILQSLLSEEKEELAKALVEMHFTKGEQVIEQGELGNTFYILYDGAVEIIKDGKSVSELEANQARGTSQYFGEGALLDNETRQATVQVTSDIAKALVLDRDAFQILLGPLKDIIEASRSGVARTKAQGGGRASVSGGDNSDKPRDKIIRKDLVKIGLLGCGGFGVVELNEHKVTKETFAMKGLSKGYIVKTGMQESVMNEKNILMMTNSPFIIKCFETFNASQFLYFLLEPALGGELYATYNRKGLHGSDKHARFYAAGTIFAFEHLHARRIIYRDLKPENLLITESGYVKLTDMGLAKFVIGKSFTTCGTPDYFAPELIEFSGHTRAVDWWTLGVLIFELMSGHPPFESAYPMQIYGKVIKGINKVPFPPKCQGAVGDLVKSLLKYNPSERLACRPGGVENVKTHAWFAQFDWKAMQDQSMDPPYRPVVKSKKDLQNFKCRMDDVPKAIEYKENGTGWDKSFATST